MSFRRPNISVPPDLMVSGDERTSNQRPRLAGICPTGTPLGYGGPTAGEGQTLTIQYALGSSAGSAIRSVVLMRPGAVTHATDMEQRLIRLSFTDDTDNHTLCVTMRYSAKIAPPGWYMLFLVDNSNVYSAGTWVQLHLGASASCPVPEG